jgi:hypothetical protein
MRRNQASKGKEILQKAEASKRGIVTTWDATVSG